MSTLSIDGNFGGVAKNRLNSGNWVESKSRRIEHHNGRIELIRYEDFAVQFPRQSQLAIVEELEDSVPELVLA